MKYSVRPIKTLRPLFALVVMCFMFMTAAAQVSAFSVPAFPSCSAPMGELVAQYDSGVHGIAGRSGEYTGSDKVYSVNENQVTQCYCPDTGSTGIKTDWMRVDGISDPDRSILEKAGWVFIPNGQLWGLAEAPYMAKNMDYSCKQTGDSGSGNGGSSNSSSSGDSGAGSVLGSSTSFPQILGLADTGASLQNIVILGALLTSSLASVVYFIKRS